MTIGCLSGEWLDVTTVRILQFMNLRQSLHCGYFCEHPGQGGGPGLLTAWRPALEEVCMGHINKAHLLLQAF